MKFAFISWHQPTDLQRFLAAKKGITLHHIGDADAKTVTDKWVAKHGVFDGVVHPVAGTRLAVHNHLIGVFENANQAPVGEKPWFATVDFHTHQL